MDTYQPIYDAVRSRLSNGDIGAAISETLREANIAHYSECVAREIQYRAAEVAAAMTKPSVIYRPSLRVDGKQWCALYGKNLQDGIAGFGDTPAAAMSDFDKNWAAALSGGGGG